MSNKTAGNAPVLKPTDQHLLLALARSAIQTGLHAAVPAVPPADMPSALQGRYGVFVSLHDAHGELRGCLGVLESDQPLYRTVAELAKAAASEDDRFAPLTTRELPETIIEISVLTPLRRITDIETIAVGRHGLLVRQGTAEGLLLPQVAVEYKWDRTQFLAETCGKAGLPQDAWRKGAEIWLFEAKVFQDKRLPQRHSDKEN
jgi:AmmeMemoRadiSam system protein A